MEQITVAIAVVVALVIVWILMNKSHEKPSNSCGSAV